MRTLTVLLGLALTAVAAQAQTYPSRSVTVVVPFPAGGPSDIIARIVSEHMSKTLGQTLVIENVAGAGGTIGSARVVAAVPDGYTILAGSMGSHVSAPVLTPNMKYDPARDFSPIGLTAHGPAIVVGRKDLPAANLQEFIKLLRAGGENVKQAHGGIGSSSHMACLLFTTAIGVKPTLVAYRGVDQAVSNLAGGHVDFFCDAVVSSVSHVNAGTLRAYAVSSTARLPVLPNVPTAIEQGVKFQMSIWAGMFAPKGTPAAVVQKLAQALDQALDDPHVTRRIRDLGGAIPSKDERSPAKFASFVRDEIAQWSALLRDASRNAK